MKSFFYLCALSFFTSISSCTSNVATLPESWPSPLNDENSLCVNLTGTYFNKAIEATTNQDREFHEKHDKWSIHLSKLLVPYIPKKGFDDRLVDSIELYGVENGILDIILKVKEDIILIQSLKAGNDFICDSQYLVMTDKSSPENMMGISERFETTKYSKGTDGSILVSIEETEIGTLVVVPYGETLLQYYRFLPIEPKNQNNN